MPFKWDESEQKAFVYLKFHLSNSPILAHIDLEAQLILRTDASLEDLGEVLSQKKDGVETVLHYLNKRLEEGERIIPLPLLWVKLEVYHCFCVLLKSVFVEGCQQQ